MGNTGVETDSVVCEASVDEVETTAEAPRGASAWLMTILCALAIGVVWFGSANLPLISGLDVDIVVGASVAVGVWLLVLGAACNRALLKHQRELLRSVRDRQTLFPEPREPRAIRKVTPAYVPGVLILALAGAAVAMHVLTPGWALAYGQWGGAYTPSPAIGLGAVCTLLVCLPAIAGVRNRILAGLRAIEHDAATRNTDVALGAVQHMPVMVSVCTPDGRRVHLNAHFIEVVGLGEEELLDRAWMNHVAEDDRETVAQAFADQSDAGQKELEYGLVGVGGETLWIRESFVPRFDDKGQVAGYLATGLDITAQVQNESDLQASIDRFQEEANALRDENWQLKDELETARTEHKAEVRELKDELTKTKRSRDRWQSKVEGAQAQAKEAKDQAAAARSELTEGKNEVKGAKGEIKAAQAEVKEARAETQRIESQNRKLQETIEKLEKLIESQRSDEDKLKEQLESTAQQLDKSRSTAAEARRRESQLRTKINRLTSRVQELKDKMDEAMGAHAQASEESAELRATLDSQRAEVDRGLAVDLRPRLDAALVVMDGLRAQRLGDSQLGELESALASVVSIATYVDTALGRTPEDPEGSESVRPFDLRHAVQSVARLLEPIGTERAVEVDCEISPDFPPQVCGDSALIREALYMIGASAIDTLSGGKVVLKLSADGQAATDVAARCEIYRKDEGPGAEVIESLFGPAGSSDPRGVQAQLAWRLVSRLKGEHGVEQVGGDGFRVWFTIAMLRRRAEDVTGGAVVEAQQAHAGQQGGGASGPGAPAASGGPAPASAPAPAPVPARPEQTLRLPQEMLTSNLGDVLELGPSSARVQTTKKLSGSVTLTINADDKLTLEAEVESCEKVGLRSSEAVLRFTGVTAEQHRTIQQIAMAHRRQSTIRVGA